MKSKKIILESVLCIFILSNYTFGNPVRDLTISADITIKANPAEQIESIFQSALDSADLGLLSEEYFVGELSHTGVTKDYIQAYRWLNLSVTGPLGNRVPYADKAKDMPVSLAEKMTPQQLEEPQKLTEQWTDNNVNRMDIVLHKKGDVTGVVDSDVVVISVGEAGQIEINNKLVSFLNLGKELRAIYSTLSNKKMLVNASPRVIYGDVVRIIDIAQGAGVGKIGLIAEEISFTIMTSFLREGIPVNLPNAKNSVEDKDSGKADAIVIALNRDGRLYLKKRPITDPGLYDYLTRQYSSGEINRTVYLMADQSLMYGRVVQIVEVCRDAGVDQIGLMAEKD